MADKQCVSLHSVVAIQSGDIVIILKYPGGQNAVPLEAPMATRPQVVRILTWPLPTSINKWCYDFI